MINKFSFLTELLITFGVINIHANAGQTGGGERRAKIINLNCDPKDVILTVSGYDWLNNYAEFELFRFISKRGNQGYSNGDAILPPTALDASATNDGNTFYLPYDYYDQIGNQRPFVHYNIINGIDRENSIRILASQLETSQSLYISCDYNGNGGVDAVTLTSNNVYTIVGFEDTKAYAINDFSCTGGIGIYGVSGRFYGEDYPGISSVLIPEWDYPVQICKLDREPFSDCKSVLRHEGQGRNVYCLGNDWWLTGDYVYACLNNCRQGKFSRNNVFDDRFNIRTRNYNYGPRSRRCIHADKKDPRVKLIECTQYEQSQEMIYDCQDEYCVIQNRETGEAITVNNDNQIVWTPSRPQPFPQQQQWIIHRNGENIAFESLLHSGMCLVPFSSRQQVQFIPCDPNKIHDTNVYAFVVDTNQLTLTSSQSRQITRPELTFFTNDNRDTTDYYNYGSDYIFNEDLNSGNAELTTIRYCGGSLNVYGPDFEVYFISPSKHRFESPKCSYVYLTPEQRALATSYVFIPAEQPITFPSIQSNTNLAFFDSNGKVLEYNEEYLDYTNLPSINTFITNIEKITFCGVSGSLLVILESNIHKYRLDEDGCINIDGRDITEQNFLFSYRSTGSMTF
eukprot:Pgem_evm1s869